MTYLGCQVNQYSNITQEISKRITHSMTMLKKLDIFWRHCDVKIGFKINVLDAVIKSKLLYGIDSAQLTTSNQRKIKVFQLKGLRKILKMTTSFVERHNSNAEVFRRANETLRHETPPGKTPKIIKPFVTCYLNSRMKRLARIHKMPKEHPVRHITIGPDPENNCVPWNPSNRRVGRPRFQWITETVGDIWANIRHEHIDIPQQFDRKVVNKRQHEAVKNAMHSSTSSPSFLFSS